ncbi:GvpL/GvpF family gas vesicle protein [Bacillus sp. FJAT-18017]|uniref:GvpL/GvpF family gas vesicle protein n=1 Tax=Bacillus sp. FJAT-18017 TaxID=1705566 RepID=UPI000AF3B2C7|nr:GvpL/GvpF family gas vesicle protein [Bacillus sp. FJAT-18017]
MRAAETMEDLIYLYGLVPTKEITDKPLPPFKDFDGKGEIYPIRINGITAVVCKLDSQTYTEETIKERIDNDMGWLQEKAFHHHETVLNLSKLFTIIPLKFCTLYKSENSLKESIQSNSSRMESTFNLISNNEEWNLKIYCDDKLLKAEVSANNPVIEEKREEISSLSKGKQFFEKKKLDQLIEREVEKEKIAVSEDIHLQLKGFAIEGIVKKTWGKDVTGRKDQMTWNSVYLVSKTKVEPFLEQIQQFEKDMKEKGWQFEATGPWPVYHFSSLS